mgnify:CR=1 FL=1
MPMQLSETEAQQLDAILDQYDRQIGRAHV